jgi:UDP:flavonoid glycosyltransferase YjiC (YdhE family)
LRPARRLFDWWWSPERVIGLFPDWYAPPQPDWPAQMRLAGFALSDGSRGEGLSPEVLEFSRTGPAPIVFTLGTGMMRAARFFRAAVAACRTLGARGLLVTKYERLVPSPLPSSVRHCAYAPFRQLLPHCAAVVHHGGIGTVATALTTGTPQLILPLAWDQPDNAARVKRLGAGDWLGPRQRSGAQLAGALARLMTHEARERCRAIAARFGDADGFARAAGWLEEMAAGAAARGLAGRDGQ